MAKGSLLLGNPGTMFFSSQRRHVAIAQVRPRMSALGVYISWGTKFLCAGVRSTFISLIFLQGLVPELSLRFERFYCVVYIRFKA